MIAENFRNTYLAMGELFEQCDLDGNGAAILVQLIE